MKTIRQIADEIGVSKQAVFYRIKRPPLSNALQSLMTKDSGILMVSFDGEALIKQAFAVDDDKIFGDKEPSKENTDFDSNIIKLLQDNITILQSQFEVKDRQIEELTATVRAQAESINADRKNELAETLMDGQQKFIESETTSRKWWHFWK